MITVPDEIKEKLHLDSCKKNIRIHFPNGERSDICNDLIVMNTVSFTESLCSQDSLKFGLCEAPVFECETVGVGNIKGATIEVSCEIYCDQSVSGAVWRMDLQAYVYPVQYGTFIVSEAKRQADMIHRKIVAYGGTSSFGGTDDTILNAMGPKSTSIAYEPIVFCSAIVNARLGKKLSHATTAVTITGSESSRGITTVLYNNTTVYDFDVVTKRCTPDIQNPHYMYFITAPESTLSQADATGLLYNAANLPDEVLDKFMYELKKKRWDYTKVFICGGATESHYIYPYQSGEYIHVPYGFTISSYPVGHSEQKTTIAQQDFRDKSGISIDYQDTTSYYPADQISYPRNKMTKTGYYSIGADNIDFNELLTAVLEKYGLFGNINHDGEFVLISIKQKFGLLPGSALYPDSNLYPEGVTGGKLLPCDYQTCWYEDSYTLPYGAVQCSYKNTNNVDCIYTYYLTGFDEYSSPSSYQIYDLSGNQFIDAGTWTEAQIDAICQDVANEIEGVTYMPVEFVGRGLPYVEAGDTFEILTKSNDSITTIVLNRTIKGEQVLTDSYKSV